jgi:ubiquinone/menaquinone biosynthesis C-methylase UbiE
MAHESFTPALGRPQLTFLYDAAIRVLTRERRWRRLLLEQLRPRPGERILDIGCGTGTLAIMIKQAEPEAEVVGIDPDEQVLGIARTKAARAGVAPVFMRGFARDADRFGARFDKAVASLVFHQVPLQEKEAGIEAMARAVVAGGELHVADYALQPTIVSRQLFRMVQALDGRENTQANADGALERILGSLAGGNVAPQTTIPTLTGAISLFQVTVAGA